MIHRLKISYKLIAACVLGMLLLTACSEKEFASDTQKMMLSGKVKGIEEDFYFASNSFDKVVLMNLLYKRYYRFDTSGRYAEFLHENVFWAKSSIVPDSLVTDSIVLKNDTIIDVTDSVKRLTEWTYNGNDNEVSEPNYVRKEYRYVNDSLYLICSYNKQGFLMSYNDCRLQNNRLVSANAYSDGDELLSKSLYQYDDKGRLSTKTLYFEKTSYQTSYKYSLGRKHESYSYVANLCVSSFNSKGLLSKQKNYVGDTHVSTAYYKYNKHNHLTEYRLKDEATDKEQISTYNYAYDPHNNWTERVEQRHDGNIFVTRRLIDYY